MVVVSAALINPINAQERPPRGEQPERPENPRNQGGAGCSPVTRAQC